MPNNSQGLIPIIKKGDSESWVDARTLHRFLSVGRDFSTWIKDYITDFGFIEGRDFSPVLGKSTGGRQSIEYSITLDMAKHLAMLQRSEKGMQARQYFINAEKELRRVQSALLSGYDEMQQVLEHCESQVHNGEKYYAALQLRNLAGKSFSGQYPAQLRLLEKEGLATRLQSGSVSKWFVNERALKKWLGVKPSTITSVAIVKLIHLNH